MTNPLTSTIDYLKYYLTYNYFAYLLSPFLPSDYSSKKASIISLIGSQLSNKEIAERTDTTKEYVAKIRSIHKSTQNSLYSFASAASEPFASSMHDEIGNNKVNDDGRNHNSKNSSDHSNIKRSRTEKMVVPPKQALSASLFTSAIARNMRNIGQGGYYNDPVGKETRKILWNAFDAMVSLVDIIKEHGFVPEMVEQEYMKFLHAKAVSPTEMQGAVFLQINKSRELLAEIFSKERVQEYEKILALYKTNGSVSNEKFCMLMEIFGQLEFFKGKESILNNGVAEPLIGKWTRLICRMCGKPLPGVVYDASRTGLDYIRWLHDSATGWSHWPACPAE